MDQVIVQPRGRLVSFWGVWGLLKLCDCCSHESPLREDKMLCTKSTDFNSVSLKKKKYLQVKLRMVFSQTLWY